MRTIDKKTVDETKYYVASQWELMWRKFKRHKLAIFGGIVLVFLYTSALFADFITPYDIYRRFPGHINASPQGIHFFDRGQFQLRPFVYALKQTRHPETLRRTYVEDKSVKYPVSLFVHGNRYKLFGLIDTDIHLFGAEGGYMFLFGTDKLGRDMFSRNVFAARISLSIGLVGVAISFVLGCILGGISGFYGGSADMLIQRIVEFLLCIPTIPLWMGLSAAMPPEWSPIRVYFGITIILAIRGWCGLARVVRGKILELREEDFAMAAKIAGASDMRIIVTHLLPGFFSYLIVSLTLAIPWMILGETALSFLGLGLRPPVVSWGVLLKDAQNFRTVSLHPWLLIPGLFVILTVLVFNFLGDGLRDAADPYK